MKASNCYKFSNNRCCKRQRLFFLLFSYNAKKFWLYQIRPYNLYKPKFWFKAFFWFFELYRCYMGFLDDVFKGSIIFYITYIKKLPSNWSYLFKAVFLYQLLYTATAIFLSGKIWKFKWKFKILTIQPIFFKHFFTTAGTTQSILLHVNF